MIVLNASVRQQYELSLYKELYHLDGSGKTLVIHELSQQLYVKKQRKVYDRAVYAYLQSHPDPHIPAIIAVYENKTEEGCILTVLEEYIQGETLAQKLESGILSENEKIRILSEICDGLMFLHAADPPIIHRDIKAENILIDVAGNVKIIDYDAAKQYHPGKTRDTVLIGTEGSAAPEQYGFRQSDARTDVYAVGVLIRRIFPHDPAMQQIAEKATQMDPARRYQTIEELKSKCCGHRRWYRYIPGFRTMMPRKMAAGVLGYAMMIYIALGIKVEKIRGPGDLLINRVTFFLIELLLVLFFAYKRKIAGIFRLLRSENRTLRMIGYVIGIVLIVIIPVLLMTVLEMILYGPVS